MWARPPLPLTGPRGWQRSAVPRRRVPAPPIPRRGMGWQGAKGPGTGEPGAPVGGGAGPERRWRQPMRSGTHERGEGGQADRLA